MKMLIAMEGDPSTKRLKSGTVRLSGDGEVLGALLTNAEMMKLGGMVTELSEVKEELRAWREHNDATTDGLIAAMQRLYSVLWMGDFPLTTGIEEGIDAAITEISTNWEEAAQEDW